MYTNKEIGQIGEDIAIKYLEKHNYKVIARNFICKQGEIDIIAKDDEYLIFIEVKSRTSILFGAPAEAVNEEKQKHIDKCAKYYLHINNLEDCLVRIDVIEIYLYKNRGRVNHIKQIK